MAGFEPTAQEQQVIKAVFTRADTQDLGVVTGEEAVKIFAGSGLPPTTLGEIWQLSDSDNNGFLTEAGLGVALRLIGWAQAGETPKKEFIARVGPLPTIKGIPIPGVSSNPGSPMPRSPPPSLPARPVIPPLTPEDRQKFLRMFFQSGPANGLLSGDKARDLFVKSKLPTEKLSQIWHLADTHERGSLDSTDFIIGMFLIQSVMTGQLQILPPTLPPGLYEQASGGASRPTVGSPLQAQFTGTSNSSRNASGFPQRAASPIRSQYTGQAPLEPQYTGTQPRIAPQYTGQSQLGRPPAPPPPIRPQVTGQPFAIPQTSPFVQPNWDVSPEEKAKSDSFFAGLDTQGRGYIEGDVAVTFMVQSKLPEAILAQVWDLSDIDNDGRLTRDEFAVAMHLINGKLAGRELPTKLAPSLIPPSFRTAASAPAPAAPAQSETLRDLWSLDEPVQTPTAPAPAPSAPAPALPKPQRNLFDDDEDEAISPTTATSSAPPNGSAAATHSIEIANVQNQLASTQRALDSATTARQAASASADAGAAELTSLKEQLARATAARASEETHLNEIRVRKVAQDAELTKVREELIRVESEVSAIRLERGELETSLLRDKEELRGVQKRVREVSEETERAKGEVEKFKREARQVKGLLAIARKQLGTAESEKTKVEKEGEEARNETEEARQELEDVERKVAQAESEPATIVAPVPTVNGASPATMLSPQSTGIDRISPAQVELPASRAATPAVVPQRTGSTNPFDRLRAMSASSGSSLPFADVPAGQSPFTGAPFGNNATSPTVASPFGSAPETASSMFGVTSAPAPAPATDLSAFDAVFGDVNTFGEGPKDESTTDLVKETTADATPKPPLAPIAQPSTHGPADDEDPFGMDAEEKHEEGNNVKADEKLKEERKVEDQPKVDVKPKEDDALAAAASQFPALSVQNSPNPNDLPPLTEIEHQDDDTDSDDEPLDKKVKRLTVKQGDLGTAPLAAVAGAGAGAGEGGSAPAPAPPGPPFDIFGSPSAPAAPPAAPAPAPAAAPASATGIDAFDQALKSISPSQEDNNTWEGFQNSFDGNFDFESKDKDKGTNTTATPVVPGAFSVDEAPRTSSVTSNGTGTGTNKGISFDEPFGTTNGKGTPFDAVYGISSKSDAGSAKPSLDAFGSSPFAASAPGKSSASAPAPEPVPVPTPVHAPATASTISRPSPPTSPTSASMRSGRGSSPRNHKRPESPKSQAQPRTQLSPPPEPGQRLSKFNLHLPSFGRSKTTKDKSKGKKSKELIPDMPHPPAALPLGPHLGLQP
ncbi:EH domain-containing and endocytosis protein 1 [Rhizoctonia solani]|uniref:EH domain-containing and endocytosis protein 1 n=1 Tax=Rhizoctonia solani TaxID=456999 RepID=A0A0K6GB73_9AGAM|nr:EH domain-containing and endocytosis protein 1 [Rhizoctonia solani]